jgi:hypothetical protein
MKYKIIIIILILCLNVFLQAQSSNEPVSKVGTVAATFLEIPVGAKSAGMGGAFVSISNDVSALYWNVAGIMNLDRNEIMGIHTRWIGETSFDFAGLVIPFGESGAFGVSFTSLSMDDMKVRTVDKPEGTGEYFSAGDISIGLSYAFTLTERFAIGFTGKYIQQKIWHMTANAFALDAGTTFRTDLLNGMVIGASISNFGTQMKMEGRDTRSFKAADETKMGSNQNIPQNTELDSWDLPLLFQIGVSTNAIQSEQFRWTVAVDALHPADNYESLNIGTELAFQEFIFLRGGYKALFLDDNEGGVAIGVGFTTKSLFSNVLLKFDFAYQDMSRLENAQFLSVALEF